MVNRGVQGWSVAQHEVVVVYFVDKTTLTHNKFQKKRKKSHLCRKISLFWIFVVNRGVQGWSVAQYEVVVVYFVHKTTLTLHKTSISEKKTHLLRIISLFEYLWSTTVSKSGRPVLSLSFCLLLWLKTI